MDDSTPGNAGQPSAGEYVDLPDYDLDAATGLAILRSRATYLTGIKGRLACGPFIQLCHDGYLICEPGYLWDLGSGPAVDDPPMAYASLAHDALYDLMHDEQLPWSCRKAADKLLVALLKRAGAPWLRCQWVYWGVRLGYPIAKALGWHGKGSRRPVA